MPKTELGALAERATYRAFHMVSTRWADNDQYGHINNAKFYEFVDSAVNAHLIIAGALKDSIGLVVDSGNAAPVDHSLSVVPRVRHQNADFAFLVKPLPCESTTYAHFCGSFVVATA